MTTIPVSQLNQATPPPVAAQYVDTINPLGWAPRVDDRPKVYTLSEGRIILSLCNVEINLTRLEVELLVNQLCAAVAEASR